MEQINSLSLLGLTPRPTIPADKQEPTKEPNPGIPLIRRVQSVESEPSLEPVRLGLGGWPIMSQVGIR